MDLVWRKDQLADMKQSVSGPLSTRSCLRMLVTDMWRRLNVRVPFLLCLSAFSGLLEGVGVLLFLPLLSGIGIGGAGTNVPLVGDVGRWLSMVGLETTIGSVLGVIVGVFAIQYVVFVSYGRVAARLQFHYEALWRRELFFSYFNAEWAYFTRRRSGELANTLVSEANRVCGAFETIMQVSSAALVISIYVGLAAATSWPTTVYLLLVGAVLCAVTGGLVRRGHRIGTDISRRTQELQSHANEFLGGAKFIKATSTEEVAGQRLSAIVDSIETSYFLSYFHRSLLRGVFEFGAIVALSVMLAVGVRYVNMDPAHILVVLALFLRLYPRLSNIQQQMQALNVYLPAIQTTTAALEAARSMREPIDDRALPTDFCGGPVALEIRNLRVDYGKRTVLDGVNLSLTAGTTTAIVGPSGSGKSTLVDCVLGLVRPRSGTIKCNDVDLTSLPLRAWRRSVGYVGQDTFLFHASVRENLLWGQESGDSGGMIAAAKGAYAHEFITRMPDGYDTVVGDRGVTLSGGERQRLGLARALVSRPSLLILDEATSALDSEAEETVLGAVRALGGDVTTITIAHRLSSVRDADRICVLEDGRVVETGTREDLLARGGRFAELWAMQNRGN